MGALKPWHIAATLCCFLPFAAAALAGTLVVMKRRAGKTPPQPPVS